MQGARIQVFTGRFVMTPQKHEQSFDMTVHCSGPRAFAVKLRVGDVVAIHLGANSHIYPCC